MAERPRRRLRQDEETRTLGRWSVSRLLTGPVLGSRQRGLLARVSADAWELIKKEQEAKARLDQKRQKVQRCLAAQRLPCSGVLSMLRLPL